MNYLALNPRADVGLVRVRQAARAFTLIELLTVIAIVGILAAIIIPVVGKVRKSALRAECVSNLRQLSSACTLYANDNKGFYPRPYTRLGATDTYWNELIVVGGYLGRPNSPIGAAATTGVPQSQWKPYHYTYMTCKSHRQAVPAEGAQLYLHPSYSGNGSLAPAGVLSTWRPRMENFRTPSRLAYIADGPAPSGATGAVINSAFWNGSSKPDAARAHDGVANILFFDGHVEPRRAEQIPSSSGGSADNSMFWTGS